MPNRIIREGHLDSERVDRLSPMAEVFYGRLRLVVDDYGRFETRPNLLLSKCFPLRPGVYTVDECRGWLQECYAAELLAFYSVDGREYLELYNFGQRLRTVKKGGVSVTVESKFPNPVAYLWQRAATRGETPPLAARASETHSHTNNEIRNTPTNSGGETRPIAEEKAIALATSRFADFWAAWSGVRGTAYRDAAVRAWLSCVPDELGDAAIGCTLSYLASLDNPAKGFRPDNFLFEHARERFEARWPAHKPNGRAGPADRKAAAMQEFLQRMAEEKGISYG